MVGRLGILGPTVESGTSAYVLAHLLYLVLPSLVVGGLALHLSKRFDNRTPKAVGLDAATFYTGFVWVFAGLVVATPSIVTILTSGANLGQLPLLAAVLTPIIIVQAGAEEILFRGVILGSLAARYGARVGLLLSAVFFGLWHLVIGDTLLDSGIAFFSTFIFGLSAGVLTLHYANLGPSLVLHVMWNVAIYLRVAATSDPDSWVAWTFAQPWRVEDIQNGDFLRLLIVPKLLETLIVFGACRVTIARLFRARRPEIASRQIS
jgi:membrane protease YdiL (CAAX protease family)